VRLVVQGQHMSKDKGDFTDAFSPVPHLSGVRCCMCMATAMKWKAVGVDLTQGFIQADLPNIQAELPKARHMVALVREPRFLEGRIRGCYVEQKGQGW
jgi:hypothetical protein